MIQTIRYSNGERLAFTDCGERAGHPVLVQHGLIASLVSPRTSS